MNYYFAEFAIVTHIDMYYNITYAIVYSLQYALMPFPLCYIIQ